MRTHKEKQQFVADMKTVIKHREALTKFFETTFKEVVQKFDGKVYNIRFDKALNEAMQKVSPLMRAECKTTNMCQYSNKKDGLLVEIQLRHYFKEGNYSNVEMLYTNVVLKYDISYNARISAKDSAEEKYTIAWAESFAKGTEEAKTTIKNYDKYMKLADKMEQAVKEYNKIPYYFRENIDKNYLTIY